MENKFSPRRNNNHTFSIGVDFVYAWPDLFYLLDYGVSLDLTRKLQKTAINDLTISVSTNVYLEYEISKRVKKDLLNLTK